MILDIIGACLSGGIGRRTGLKILRELNHVPVQVRPEAPLWRNTQVWLKGLVLKTRRSGNRRGGSNPSFSATNFLHRGMEQSGSSLGS